MIIYISATILSICIALLFAQKNKNNYSFFVLLSALPLFLVSALRAWTGTDYMCYYYNQTYEVLSGIRAYLEPNFQLLILFSIKILGDFQWVIVTFAFLTIFFMWKAFNENSPNIAFSILIFVCMGCFYMSLNMMRQMTAIAIFFYAIKFIQQKKYLYMSYGYFSPYHSTIPHFYFYQCIFF